MVPTSYPVLRMAAAMVSGSSSASERDHRLAFGTGGVDLFHRQALRTASLIWASHIPHIIPLTSTVYFHMVLYPFSFLCDDTAQWDLCLLCGCPHHQRISEVGAAGEVQAFSFCGFLFNYMVFHPKAKIKDMEQPDCAKDCAGNIKRFLNIIRKPTSMRSVTVSITRILAFHVMP